MGNPHEPSSVAPAFANAGDHHLASVSFFAAHIHLQSPSLYPPLPSMLPPPPPPGRCPRISFSSLFLAASPCIADQKCPCWDGIEDVGTATLGSALDVKLRACATATVSCPANIHLCGAQKSLSAASLDVDADILHAPKANFETVPFLSGSFAGYD